MWKKHSPPPSQLTFQLRLCVWLNALTISYSLFSNSSKFEIPSDASINEQFIQLMCEFEASAVYRYLLSGSNYRLQETLEVPTTLSRIMRVFQASNIKALFKIKISQLLINSHLHITPSTPFLYWLLAMACSTRNCPVIAYNSEGHFQTAHA